MRTKGKMSGGGEGVWYNLLHVVKLEGKNCKSESDFLRAQESCVLRCKFYGLGVCIDIFSFLLFFSIQISGNMF